MIKLGSKEAEDMQVILQGQPDVTTEEAIEIAEALGDRMMRGDEPAKEILQAVIYMAAVMSDARFLRKMMKHLAMDLPDTLTINDERDLAAQHQRDLNGQLEDRIRDLECERDAAVHDLQLVKRMTLLDENCGLAELTKRMLKLVNQETANTTLALPSTPAPVADETLTQNQSDASPNTASSGTNESV